MEAVTHPVKKWWSNMESIWTVIITEDVLLSRPDVWCGRAHQEDDVGVLVKSSGHTDSLPLTSAQVDTLNHNNTREEAIPQEEGHYRWCRAEMSTEPEQKSIPVLQFQFGPQRAKGRCQAAVSRRQSRPCTWNNKGPQCSGFIQHHKRRRTCSHLCLLKGLPKTMFSSTVALSNHDFWAA